MLVAHGRIALAMVGLGVACVIPAYLLAEDHHDDGRGDGRGPDPVDPDPGPGSGPDLWDEFERDFWSHVERTRELVNSGPAGAPGGPGGWPPPPRRGPPRRR